MLKIERKGTGYKVTSSGYGAGLKGWSEYAKNLKEVKDMVEHYYGVSHYLNNKDCPLCKRSLVGVRPCFSNPFP